MHSYTWKTPKTEVTSDEVTFHYNSDLSGKVIISVEGKETRVPGHALLAFVAYCYVLQNKIRDLEDQDWQKLLRM